MDTAWKRKISDARPTTPIFPETVPFQSSPFAHNFTGFTNKVLQLTTNLPTWHETEVAKRNLALSSSTLLLEVDDCAVRKRGQ